jgi:uncharacterized protein (UPF0297 family)
MDETMVINRENILSENARVVLKGICLDLEEKGYNAFKQITEYLITGELGYISSYKECRERIQGIDRRDVIEYMLKEFVK